MIIKIEKFGDAGGMLFGEMTICASAMKRLRLQCTEYEVDFSGEEIKYDLCPCDVCQRSPSSLVRFFAPDFQVMRKGNLELPAKEGTFTLWRTKQSIFDQVAQHLLTQNKISMFVGQCRYRIECGDRVLKCAVGCLIPDEAYVKEMDDGNMNGGGSIHGAWRVKEVLLKERIREWDLLAKLQNIHDNYAVRYWAEELRSLAESEGLQWTVQSAVSS